MSKNDWTSMGGGNVPFPVTQWTEILSVNTIDPSKQKLIIENLISRYWKPVYAYLRCKGKSNEEAKDLTQGFFTDIVLDRDLLQKAQRGKGNGRFRNFLLTALDRYTASDYRAEHAQKRKPREGLISISQENMKDLPIPSGLATPEQALEYSWAAQLLDEVLLSVENGCREAGQEKHWKTFKRKILEPILTGIRPPSLSELCNDLNIESPDKGVLPVSVREKY